METYTLIDIIKAAHELISKTPGDAYDGAYQRKGIIEFVERLTGYTLYFGGGGPVERDTEIRTIQRYDIVSGWHDDILTNDYNSWIHVGAGADVLAYRVVDPPKPKVDRSLRGHVMVIKGDKALPTEALATKTGIYIEATIQNGYAGLWLWADVEHAGWEIYKP